ncbi:MAG TPA: aminoacyl-tRNA hydrolase [Desulfobacterales bacterium]|nr:aminoacyl-tRNA hydrolase [Desulfobacterales bacterium]
MPKDRCRLIVGLGNPGEAYRFTRHNIGFMVVDALARRHNILVNKRRFEAVFGVGCVGKRSVLLAKPMTFMNLSGQAVRNLVHFFKLGTKDLLVIHDDIDLVFGKIKIKQRGGDGGHKGLKSLIETLGNGAFARLRIGIGRPGTKQEVEGYVLNRFDAQQEEVVYKVITMAQDAVETILLKGLTQGMNCFSGKEV